MSTNLASDYLKANGQTVEDWEGDCGGLADEIISDKDHVIWVEGEFACEFWQWKYHMVPLIGGLIHDAWCPGGPLPLKAWLSRLFGDGWVEVSLDGDVIYDGFADEFYGECAGLNGSKKPS